MKKVVLKVMVMLMAAACLVVGGCQTAKPAPGAKPVTNSKIKPCTPSKSGKKSTPSKARKTVPKSQEVKPAPKNP